MAMKTAEIVSFAKLMTDAETSRNLVRVFFLRQKLQGLAGRKPPKVKHVHVIGAGAMGGDIAAWCAWRGLTVTLGDVKPEPIAGAIKRAAELYVKIGHKDNLRIRDALDRLIPDLKGEGIARADIVIEAAPENLKLKHSIYAAVEPKMKDGAILASNTSSIPLRGAAHRPAEAGAAGGPALLQPRLAHAAGGGDPPRPAGRRGGEDRGAASPA